MEEMSTTDIARLIERLREHGHTDSEIVDCLEYITKNRADLHSLVWQGGLATAQM